MIVHEDLYKSTEVNKNFAKIYRMIIQFHWNVMQSTDHFSLFLHISWPVCLYVENTYIILIFPVPE